MKDRGSLLGIHPASTVNRPVFVKELEGGVGAEANRDGTTFLSPKVKGKDIQTVVDHEDVHHDQMIQGRLAYTHDNVTWKESTRAPLQVFARENLKDGDPNFAWEKEAYNKEKNG